MIPESFIQDLLGRIDVVDVVGRYVNLRKGGANLLGLCPFHNEKTPSFTVSPTKQFYHCFGCGAHGSAITFLIEHTGASFPEAVQTLASSVGLTVPQEPRSPARQAAQKRYKQEVSQHQQALEKAQSHYLAQLRKSPEAIRYLKGRGLDGKLAARFGLGWSGSNRQGLADVFSRYEDPLLVESGLVIEADDGRRYDRFRERVMFPIHNARGQLVGFGGRLIAKGEPKYLNSPETPIFQKGRELYGLWEARQAIRRAACVIVVEGYMDVVSLAGQGVEHAVATLGTATTPDHIQRLLRVSNKIVFSFDGDRAGRAAAWRALEASLPLLRDDVVVRFLFLPDDHDPDSYCRKFGAPAFLKSVDEALPLSRYLLDTLASHHAMDEAEGRAACVHEAGPLLARLPQGTLRVQIERELAQMVLLTPEELSAMLAAAQQSRERRPYEVRQVRQAGQAVASAAGPVASTAAPARGGLPGGFSGAASSGQEPGDSPFAFASSSPERPLQRRRPGSRAVMPMAKRLMRLLLAHPELIARMGDQQLEIIEQSPHLRLVKGLIVLMHSSEARHVGALLQAVEPDTELAEVLHSLSTDIMTLDELPSPEAEWADALNRVELDLIRAEQSELVESGLKTEATRERYKNLAKRMAALSQS